MEEAIQCYNVCFFRLSIYSSFSLWILFPVINIMLLREAMPSSATKPPTSSYQPWEYIHGMVHVSVSTIMMLYIFFAIYFTASLRNDL